MIRNLTIQELEATATMRVVLDRLIDFRTHMPLTRYAYDVALTQSVYATNDILIELGINRELWVRIRGKRAYMFHEPTNRIVAELGVVTDDAGDGWRKRLKIVLFGKGGHAIKELTVGDLAVSAAKLGAFQGSGMNRRASRRT